MKRVQQYNSSAAAATYGTTSLDENEQVSKFIPTFHPKMVFTVRQILNEAVTSPPLFPSFTVSFDAISVARIVEFCGGTKCQRTAVDINAKLIMGNVLSI